MVASAADFLKGAKEGYGTVVEARRARQEEKMNDILLENGELSNAGIKHWLKKMGAEAELGGAMEYPKFNDPLAFRWAKMLGNKLKRKRQPTSAIPPPAGVPVATDFDTATAAEDQLGYGDPTGGGAYDANADLYNQFADGGRVRRYAGGGPVVGASAEALRYLAQLSPEGAATAEGLNYASQLGYGTTPAASAAATPAAAAPAGLAARAGAALKAGASKAYTAAKPYAIPAYVGATVAEHVGTETDDYHKRFGGRYLKPAGEAIGAGLPPGVDDVAPWVNDIAALGTRTAGFVSDLANPLNIMGRLGIYDDKSPNKAPDRDENVQHRDPKTGNWAPRSTAAVNPTPAPPTDAAAAVAATVPREKPSAIPTTAAARNQPAEQQGPPVPEGVIPFEELDVDPNEIPNMTTDDWVMSRRDYIIGAVAQGMDPMKANSVYTNMQHERFMFYGKRGQALLAAGQPTEAAKYLKAAFQYMPNGTDVQFGIKGNNLIAVVNDEKTGKQITQRVLNNDTLAALVANYEDPKHWNSWTLDWRKLEQEIRKYNEVDKPVAAAGITRDYAAADALRTGALADLTRADAAVRAAGPGGMTNAQFLNHEKFFAAEIDNNFALTPYLAQNPALRTQLAQAMSLVKIQRPDLPSNVVIDIVTKMWMERQGLVAGEQP